MIFRLFGIPVLVDYRWIFVVGMMTVVIALTIPLNYLDDFTVRLILGFVTTLILFVCVVGHEFAHAFAAKMEGIATREIVLHPFGGMARLAREPDTPRAEFRIAIAGPVASFFIAVLFLVLATLVNHTEAQSLRLLLNLLFFFNLLLAVFNMFPGYPLDGGRVLRAFLWRRGYELNEATILTGRCGQLIATALMIFGLFVLVTRADFTGLWTILVGVFLLDSASEVIKYSQGQGKVTVGEVMAAPYSIDPDTTVANFIDRTLTLIRQTTFAVAKNKQLYGILTLEDLKSLPREKWHDTRIAEVMRPVKPEYFVETTMLYKDAKEIMDANGIDALCVIDETGRLTGYLQPGKIKS